MEGKAISPTLKSVGEEWAHDQCSVRSSILPKPSKLNCGIEVIKSKVQGLNIKVASGKKRCYELHF